MDTRRNDLPPAQFGLPYDCEPTLNDAQVFDFCRKGYLILEGVVDDDVNRRMMAFAAEHTDHQPLELLTEEWFVEGVFKNPQAAGAVRSLLGANFKLPQTLCNHRADGPLPPQDWHRDGGSIYNNRIDYLQVFYYPQDTPPEMGPTELIPGSHFMRSKANYMGHIRSVKPVKSTASPAGTVTITAYPIWHRRGRSVCRVSVICSSTTTSALPNRAVTGSLTPNTTFHGPTCRSRTPFRAVPLRHRGGRAVQLAVRRAV